MQTPDTKAGRLTEGIMAIFSKYQNKKVPVELNVQQYNEIYSHVLRTLEREGVK
jgi:hypothetical protein